MVYTCFPLDMGYLPSAIGMAFSREDEILLSQKIFYMPLCGIYLFRRLSNVRTFHLYQTNSSGFLSILRIKNKPITAGLISPEAKTMRYSSFPISPIIKLETQNDLAFICIPACYRNFRRYYNLIGSFACNKFLRTRRSEQ